MVDFITALATASQALKLLNDLRGIEKEFDRAELKLKIAELSSSIADIKITLVEAREELGRKQEEIAFLEKQILRVADTVERAGYLYEKRPNDEPKGHPFCSVCWQVDGYLFNTVSTNMPGRPEQCPKCKSLYHDVAVFTD
jgi:predicted Zn-ribbon and HTH transcriptional regulator